MSLIRLREIVLRRGCTTVLDGLSLELAGGQTLALLGPSGSGKSTLLRVILGLDAPDEGSVELAGRRASGPGRVLLPPPQRRLAVLFQDLALWPHLTVRDNLAFGLSAQGVRPPEAARRIDDMLQRVQLCALADRHPAELSGGECQRVALARALVLEPDALLLDEPLSNLDVTLRQELLELFAELFAERSSAVLYVTHDPWEAAALECDVAIMEGGQISYRGQLAKLSGESPFIHGIQHALGRSGSR